MAGETYYRFETTDGCRTITLLAELNEKQWADIEKVGTEIVEQINETQSPKLMVDLSPLSYMSSAMVALLVRFYKAVNSRNGRMVVVNHHELVHEVLKLAGLTNLWTIVDGREKGLSALGIKQRAPARAGGGGGIDAGGNTLMVAAIIGVVGAIIGLALQLSSAASISPRIALLIEFGFAALGMVCGTLMLVNQSGTRRNIGIALLAVSLLVVLGGIVLGPDRDSPRAPAPAANSAAEPPGSSPSSSSGAKAAAESNPGAVAAVASVVRQSPTTQRPRAVR